MVLYILERGRLPRCSVFASPLSEWRGLAVTAVAARRPDVSHIQGCRTKISKSFNCLPIGQVTKNAETRTEIILQAAIKF